MDAEITKTDDSQRNRPKLKMEIAELKMNYGGPKQKCEIDVQKIAAPGAPRVSGPAWAGANTFNIYLLLCEIQVSHLYVCHRESKGVNTGSAPAPWILRIGDLGRLNVESQLGDSDFKNRESLGNCHGPLRGFG